MRRFHKQSCQALKLDSCYKLLYQALPISLNKRRNINMHCTYPSHFFIPMLSHFFATITLTQPQPCWFHASSLRAYRWPYPGTCLYIQDLVEATDYDLQLLTGTIHADVIGDEVIKLGHTMISTFVNWKKISRCKCIIVCLLINGFIPIPLLARIKLQASGNPANSLVKNSPILRFQFLQRLTANADVRGL